MWTSSLTTTEKDHEKENIERSISSLQTRLSLLTGEELTLRGRFKALGRDYGMPFLVYWWSLWGLTGAMCYGGIHFFDVDVLVLLEYLDDLTGYDISTRVDPSLGEVAVAVALNEMLEPVRLPFVVVTTKKVVDGLGYGPKYK
ncbi:hypothetical protein TL16_g12677 [Triparma laevis f. inornata]|uniref:DUF1279 domain-containing protein n=1 Tax=Triparma laevis f. inornata TaxID=1714386 RepID=A0A9W7EUY2_9STRA|nr:hypothetical protein TL16_g12677 [Triparma laevis f. inornata]